MHPQVEEAYRILELTDRLRNELMDTLTDDDLAFSIEQNPTIGELCRIMGEVQQSYTDSFKNLKQSWDHHAPNAAELQGSVEKLKAWYAKLNDEMKAVLETHTEEDTPKKVVDRDGYPMPLIAQIHAYREALLIFYAKVSVYLNIMDKTMSEHWQHWIG